MSNMILHCGGEEASYDQVCAVPVPTPTNTWKPVPYGDAIGFLREQVSTLGLELESERFGLNKAGDQMFGLVTLKTDRDDMGLSIGLRQSYNKSLALGVAIGSEVFVCDNLAFSANGFKVVRRNTMNVWADYRELLAGQIAGALGHYEDTARDADLMKGVGCTVRRGYAILGMALGEGVITPHQAAVAFEDWKTPRHEEFSDRNLWSLYNCVTEGLKKGAPGRIFDRHARAHAFLTAPLNYAAA